MGRRLITHHEDTHVLIDGHGVAVLCGSEATIRAEFDALRREGVEQIEVRRIDDGREWHWEQNDWGD